MNILEIYKDFILPWILNNGIKVVVILLVAYILQKIIVRLIDKSVRRIVKDDPLLSAEAEKKREDTLINIITSIAKGVVMVVAILMVLSELGMNIGPLIAGAGIIGIAVGFGGQYLIKDLISGLFIILENQYRIGDSVEVAGISGSVEDITLRVTVLRDLDGIVHHIPHGEVTTVSNKSMGVSKVNLDLGVSYDADLNKAREVINKVGEEMKADEYFGKLIQVAPSFLRVNDLGDSAVVLKITAVTNPGKQFEVTGELRKRLKEACDEAGIGIPYPQMVVHQAGK